MGKTRSLHAQINYCISQCCRIGVSKYADKKNCERDTMEGIYSVQTAENLRATADSICKFIKSEYPNIKYIKDINSEHMQKYIDYHEKQWSDRTLEEHVSRINKLQKLVSHEYGVNLDWSNVYLPKREHQHKIRDVALSHNDLEQIKNDLRDNQRRENALRAVEITARVGLRSKEVSHLRYDNIDIDQKCIHVIEGSKGGKHRDVSIRDRDLEYFRLLKLKKDHEFVTRGVHEESLNRGIRRSMERLRINQRYNKSTEHAIRKTYATERFAEEKKKGLSDHLAWCIVQKELGHGFRFRIELYNTYVKL